MTTETNTRNDAEDVVRHEYGHTIQMQQLGIIKYSLCIGLPSWLEWGNKDYYDKPWEITADIFGQVESRRHSPDNIYDGFEYLLNSKLFGPFVWFTIQ